MAARLTAGLLLPLLGVLASCQEGAPTPAPAVIPADPVPVAATFDTDRAETELLRRDLASRFASDATEADIRAGLAGDGWTCSPDPTAPTQMACTREAPRRQCTEIRFVRIKPWEPAKAQVIVACDASAKGL